MHYTATGVTTGHPAPATPLDPTTWVFPLMCPVPGCDGRYRTGAGLATHVAVDHPEVTVS